MFEIDEVIIGAYYTSKYGNTIKVLEVTDGSIRYQYPPRWRITKTYMVSKWYFHHVLEFKFDNRP